MTLDLNSEDYKRYKKELSKKKQSKPVESHKPDSREPVCRYLGKIDEVVQEHERELDSTHQTHLVSYRGLPGFNSIRNLWFFKKKKGR